MKVNAYISRLGYCFVSYNYVRYIHRTTYSSHLVVRRLDKIPFKIGAVEALTAAEPRWVDLPGDRHPMGTSDNF